MHPEDVPRLEEASRIGANPGADETEYRIRAKDGAERWLLDRFTFLKDERGVPVAQEGILVDVTEQHRIEDQQESFPQRTRSARPHRHHLPHGTGEPHVHRGPRGRPGGP